MFENTKQLKDSDKKYGDFAPYKAGTYLMRVGKVEVGETARKEWSGTAMVDTGEKMDQLTVIFDVFKMNGSNEIEKVDGEIMVNARHRVWINDGNLGWNKKENKPKEGRAVLTALFGIEPDAEIPFEDPSELINAKLSCYLTVETKKDKSKNKMMDVVPYADPIPGVEDVEVNDETVVKKN